MNRGGFRGRGFDRGRGQYRGRGFFTPPANYRSRESSNNIYSKFNFCCPMSNILIFLNKIEDEGKLMSVMLFFLPFFSGFLLFCLAQIHFSKSIHFSIFFPLYLFNSSKSSLICIHVYKNSQNLLTGIY